MFQRVIVAVVCIPLIFVVMFFLPPIAIPFAIAILSMIGVHEVLWSTGFVKNIRISTYSIILAGCIPLWQYSGAELVWAQVGLLLYFILIFVEAISSHYVVTMEKMGGAFFFSMCIPYFLSAFIRLEQMPMGKYVLLLPLVVAFSSDAAALFAGMLFGKRKLAPELSPKKTVEGAIGGFFGAIVGMLIYGMVIKFGFQGEVNFLFLALYGALGSVIAQLGDLSFSYVKRQYDVKDFGNVFPGHGGVLDRFDSVIFCAPLIELLVVFFPALMV